MRGDYKMATDNVRLARMEENLKSLSKSFGDHETEDANRFDRMFHFIEKQFGEINVNVKEINSKVGTLWDSDNRKTGITYAAKLGAQTVWAALILIASLIINKVI